MRRLARCTRTGKLTGTGAEMAYRVALWHR